MLATLAATDQLTYPLCFEFREAPDLAVHLPGKSIGIECVDAVSEDWDRIQDLRAREFPGSMVIGPVSRPGSPVLSPDENRAYASGQQDGEPWVGNAPERQWAQAMRFSLEKKVLKLRSDAYLDHAENWLLFQDEWPVPVWSLEHQQLAAALFAGSLGSVMDVPSFSTVLVTGSRWMTRLVQNSPTVVPIADLWK
jgi:hypothetical protein